jgi:hypothetical protein
MRKDERNFKKGGITYPAQLPNSSDSAGGLILVLSI